MLCGGYYKRRKCLEWNVQQGTWVTLPLTLSEARDASSVWRVDNSMVIMGGAGAAQKTSETVFGDGSNTRRTFKMKYSTR